MTTQDILNEEATMIRKYIRRHKRALRTAKDATSKKEAFKTRLIAYECLNIYTRQLEILQKIQERIRTECVIAAVNDIPCDVRS